MKFNILTAHSLEAKGEIGKANIDPALSNPYKKLIDITLPNTEEYSNRHGYKLIVKVFEEEKDVTLPKQYLLRQNILDNNADWLCWIDTDAIIMNMTIPLESFIINNDADFIIGEDWNGINSGVFFLKVNNKTLEFIDTCIKYKPIEYIKHTTPQWWWNSEQCAYTMNMFTINTVIVHHSLFNGYIIGARPDNDWRQYRIGPFNKEWTERKFQLGDFIVHFVGDYLSNKIVNAKHFIPQIIR